MITMGRWSLGFGAGPVRYSVPLQGRRRSGRRVHPLAWVLLGLLLLACCCGYNAWTGAQLG